MTDSDENDTQDEPLVTEERLETSQSKWKVAPASDPSSPQITSKEQESLPEEWMIPQEAESPFTAELEEIVNHEPDHPPLPIPLETLTQMRRMGMAKPHNISWADWMGPRALKPKHYTFCKLAARGLPRKELAAVMGITPEHTSTLMTNNLIQQQIQVFRDELYGKSHETRFKELLPKAIDTLEQVIDDQGAKEGARISAAEKIIDRALGKVPQPVEMETSLVKDLFQAVDRLKSGSGEILDVEPKEPDALDQWANEHLPRHEGVGTINKLPEVQQPDSNNEETSDGKKLKD